MSLSHQDVQEILRILDDSPYDELELQTANFTLHLQRGTSRETWRQETRTVATATVDTVRQVQGETAAAPRQEAPATEPGLLDVRAPMVGTFYRAPKPGAEPFVSVGSRVDADTAIAIIEVMKLMSTIPAGVSGDVVEILAEDAQLVEKGQLLLRVRPPRA